MGATKPKPKSVVAKKKRGKKKSAGKKLSKVAICINKAKAVRKKCKPAQFKKKKATVLAKAAKIKTKKEAKALKKYKDVKMPKPKESPVGIFQYKNLLYLANKDGTRSLIRYPTKAC